jgi:hypothetical protein
MSFSRHIMQQDRKGRPREPCRSAAGRNAFRVGTRRWWLVAAAIVGVSVGGLFLYEAIWRPGGEEDAGVRSPDRTTRPTEGLPARGETFGQANRRGQETRAERRRQETRAERRLRRRNGHLSLKSLPNFWRPSSPTPRLRYRRRRPK